MRPSRNRRRSLPTIPGIRRWERRTPEPLREWAGAAAGAAAGAIAGPLGAIAGAAIGALGGGALGGGAMGAASGAIGKGGADSVGKPPEETAPDEDIPFREEAGVRMAPHDERELTPEAATPRGADATG